MRLSTTLTVALCGLAIPFSFQASAQDANTETNDAPRSPRGQFRERLMERRGGEGIRRLTPFRAEYDIDGDGKLDESELTALQDDLKAYHEKLIAAFDTDENGVLDDKEWKGVLPEFEPREIELPDEIPARRGARGEGGPRFGAPPEGTEPGEIAPPEEGEERPGRFRRGAALREGAEERPPRFERGGPDEAGKPGEAGEHPGFERGFGPGAMLRGQLPLERFDTNEDGKLDEAEKAEAKEAITKLQTKVRANMLEIADRDADGVLSEDELTVFRDRAAKLHDRAGQFREMRGERGAARRERPAATPDI